MHHQDLQQNKKWLSARQKDEITNLIALSFCGIAAEKYLQKYFFSSSAFDRRLRLYYDNDSIVGYCLITFSKLTVERKQLTVIGASAAFLPEFRNSGQTALFSIKTACVYWLRHPLEDIYYADTMLSPAMYRATAKHIALVYPDNKHRLKNSVPKSIQALIAQLKELNKSSNEAFSSKTPFDDETFDYRLWVGRKTDYSDKEIEQLKHSDKTEIKLYCEANPDFDKGYALLVVMPINLRQFLKMIVKRWF